MNRKPFSIVAGLIGFLGCALFSAAAHSASLTVSVTDIDEHSGAIMLAMFDAAEAYEDGGAPVKAVKIEVTGEEVSVTFDDLDPGRYAIKLYHDANGNGEMDRNMMGLPSEGYGFSGKGGRFGAPPFDDAAFEINDGDTNAVVIKLR
ncbi:MAG: DUF2141 domain-containing protein [Pseudomonadota bacterium]